MVATYFHASRQGTLQEAPWVMGDPSSTFKWQVAVAGKGKKGKGRDRPKQESLENVTLNIFLDVKKREVNGGFLRGSFVEEKFNLLSVARTILRALHKAKFRDVEAITGDGKTIYYAKVDDKPFREIVEDLGSDWDSSYTDIKIRIAHGNNRRAYVHISRRHSRKKAPITVSFEGKMSTGALNTLLGYIKKHVPVKEVSY